MLDIKYNDLFKLIDSFKFLNNDFHEGKVPHIFDWIFKGYYNFICVNIIKPIDELDVNHDCTIYSIKDFYPSIIRTTKGIDQKYIRLLDMLMSIRTHYINLNDDVGVDFIRKLINGYYPYISGHIFTYQQMLKKLFDERIEDITKQLKEINPNIVLVNNHVIVYDKQHNNLLKFFEWNNWEYDTYKFSFKEKKFALQEK